MWSREVREQLAHPPVTPCELWGCGRDEGQASIPFVGRVVVEAACPGAPRVPLAGDTQHLLRLACVWLEFPWKPCSRKHRLTKAFNSLF